MTTTIEQLVNELVPRRTVLLLGSGSSIPSGAPSADKLASHFSAAFTLPAEGYRLSELASLAEAKTNRHRLIAELRKLFTNLKPSGGLQHLPLYEWKSIFTTNYDHLVEDAYAAHRKTCRPFSSNFDFGIPDDTFDCELFKLHGTIEKDECDGHRSRIILTEADFEVSEEFREQLFDRLKGDLAGADLLIVGHSLADPDLDAVVKRALKLNSQALSPASLRLLLYTQDDHRATLFERRGLKVTFGGIDELFIALAKKKLSSQAPVTTTTSDYFKKNAALVSATLEVADNTDARNASVASMFTGWPATYCDIEAGLTFERTQANEISQFFDGPSALCAIILGAAGVGKSTAARQAIQKMRRASIRCWEHLPDFALNVDSWVQIANHLKAEGLVGALFIDDAHMHLFEVNELVDRLVADDNAHLKLLIASTKNHWYPRIKTPNLFRFGREFFLSRLSGDEIDRLLNLIDRSVDVRTLVEQTFSGFSRGERRRRLVDRCEADMFVCLKNIFASEAFDDIILREYASLSEEDQNIYKHVAAMETAGVRVHRQLVLRLVRIPSDQVKKALGNLDEIVDEYTVDERYGIYGWRCRHPVISAIVTKYKFSDMDLTIDLFERIIDGISPAYNIEIRTLRELCSLQGGLSRIKDKQVQNRLLRKMISNAPGERVPRHRLIRNLIDQKAFEKAETEIRIFNKDFGAEGPVHRYKVRLLTARAVHTHGIMDEDRIVILEQAQDLAIAGADRYPHNKNILTEYAEVGIEYYRLTGKYTIFDDAIERLKAAEERLSDPEITSIISRYERRIAGHVIDKEETVEEA